MKKIRFAFSAASLMYCLVLTVKAYSTMAYELRLYFQEKNAEKKKLSK